MRLLALPALAALILLVACGSPADQVAANGNSTAAAVENDAAAVENDESRPEAGARGVAYPDAQFAGDRFSTNDPVDKVLAWYWNPDQPMLQRDGQLWTVSKPERRDDGHLVRLTIVGDEDAQSYAIYLNPGASGGTDGRVRPITDEEIKSGVKL